MDALKVFSVVLIVLVWGIVMGAIAVLLLRSFLDARRRDAEMDHWEKAMNELRQQAYERHRKKQEGKDGAQ